MRPSRLILLTALLALLRPAPSPGAPALSEAAGWLQQYLRIDTSNPPGNEGRAAAFLAGILGREGIPSRILTTPRGRASLYARWSSPRSGGRAVLLLHHMDVVPAGPGWTAPPFSGQVRGGALWGRGALDDKSLGIAQLAALIDLKRRRTALERDVVFLAVADEESGGLQGTAWLLASHPELFQGIEGVIGEGGRSQVGPGGKVLWWGVEVAQKRPLWLEVSTSGRGGHGSGLNPDSANHQLLQGLARLLAAPARWRVSPPVRAYCQALAPLQNPHWRRVFSNLDAVIAEQGPKEFLMPGMGNLFLDTVQVTVLRGGERINVIPEKAWARLDVRLLPDTDSAAFLAEVRRRLGAGFTVKVLVTSPPAAPSPASGRLYGALKRALGSEAPVVPTFIPGFTDSRFFRERGIPAYGVSPFKLGPGDSRGIHGPDEKIPVAELDRGFERMKRILSFYAGPQGR
ncbi:MAG TPA: M20/M25/M40 family metallo-hydrolase [Thermoanaerobaculia bacterium]|jgi:acetylornithine deacetylase/succinyl-diaminopimelate desuccinylase-like protein|nr:M20/M25/M40 family metallo-hydrolase [Thermoanaerobaculia bacterium]